MFNVHFVRILQHINIRYLSFVFFFAHEKEKQRTSCITMCWSWFNLTSIFPLCVMNREYLFLAISKLHLNLLCPVSGISIIKFELWYDQVTDTKTFLCISCVFPGDHLWLIVLRNGKNRCTLRIWTGRLTLEWWEADDQTSMKMSENLQTNELDFILWNNKPNIKIVCHFLLLLLLLSVCIMFNCCCCYSFFFVVSSR